MEGWLDPVYDAAGMAAADRWTIEQAGVPSLDLMEAAGRGLARAAAELAGGRDRATPAGGDSLRVGSGSVTVVCGKGNNGGDGLVAARHLTESGFDVEVILFGDRDDLSPDSQANFDRLPEGIARVLEGQLSASSLKGVVIDAMLGTGFEGEPRDPVETAIGAINESGLPVIACDVPSGVNASTGEASEKAVRADRTVTFHQRKLGHLIAPAKHLCGPVEVIPIGIPDGAPAPTAGGAIRAGVLDLLPRRGADSNKFTSGRVSIVGGSRGLTGAVCLAAEGAIRAGAGYATAAVPGGLEDIFEAKLTEVMTSGFGSGTDRLMQEQAGEILEHIDGAAAVVLGSGVGREVSTAALVKAVAADCGAPLVLDADALSTFGTDLSSLAKRPAATVLTPHAGETARLLGLDSAEVSAHRLRSARDLATKAGAVVVLKGDDTIVTDGQRIAVNTLPAPALATAGTGDVLAGITGGFLARGLGVFEAASAAVFTHAAAGEIATLEIGNRDGVIAGDVIRAIPRAMIPPAG
ncbi:MAG: NAD(P)H-hydrate dehydratase [Solirubrobacterales bacterium]|nr:NAD(P)H-hydrate dehydratase [Solirubrobacterales bacterium]MCB8915714.1 NAD(P)H-hydrate dehydratase [Thermoleophilales bacterium]